MMNNEEKEEKEDDAIIMNMFICFGFDCNNIRCFDSTSKVTKVIFLAKLKQHPQAQNPIFKAISIEID